MLKRGQVTVFITLGIVLLILVGFFLFAFQDIIETKLTMTLDKDLTLNRYARIGNSYINLCFDLHLQKLLDNIVEGDYADVYLDNHSIVFKGEVYGTEHYFSELLNAYEEKANIILSNSNCINNVPVIYNFIDVNPASLIVRFTVGELLRIRTDIDARIVNDDSYVEIEDLEGIYGNVFVDEYDGVIRSLVAYFDNCDGDFCFPSIIYSGFNIDIGRINNDLYLIKIKREEAYIGDKELKLNFMFHV